MNLQKEVIKSIPHKPGVYRYYTKNNELLYVGKAKDLKNRVSSYFQEGRPKNERLTLMISQIDRIEYTVVESEKESLILEANLINNLQPKYNVLLKDDKSYLYVRFTNDPIPGILFARKKYDPKSEYFGPYTRKAGIINVLRTLRTIFPYCQERFPQKRPCNYVSIKQCDGICIGLEAKNIYKDKLEQIKNVLRGKTAGVENYLNQKIIDSIENSNFELAALWRDKKHILEDTISSQKIILAEPQDVDLISLIIKESETGLQIGSVFTQNIRDGKVINVANFLLSGTEEEDIEYKFLDRFLSNSYNQHSNIDVFVQMFTGVNEFKKIEKLVFEKAILERKYGIKLHFKNTFEINRDKLGELMEMNRQNAIIYLQRNELGQKLNIFEENNLFIGLVDIQKTLQLEKIPRRLECYDISHLSGKFVYGSMVVFIDGRPSKRDYRLFKTKEQNNDFENHKEVLRRRFERCLKWYDEHPAKVDKNPWELPDLIIVDGGKGQLSADLEIMDEYRQLFLTKGLKFDVDVCSLAKKLEEVFVPNQNEPYIFSGNAHFMIQRIRDEAHRFAITNNRNARLKEISVSELDSIPGVGEKTKQKLLQVFRSKENIIKNLYSNQELVIETVGENITKKLKKQFLV
ncbi:MAG: excinuclease ABC subunit C [candidate division SR1 bacterium]|nr:excinuclease ABC subunit C [candidate division SR1 bacterium]